MTPELAENELMGDPTLMFDRVRRTIRNWLAIRADVRAYRRFPETEDEMIPVDPEIWGDEDWSDVYAEWLAKQEPATKDRTTWSRILRR